MRIVRGGAPGSGVGDMWAAIRDRPQPGVKPECRAESLIETRAPLSRAMAKRQARAKAEPEIGKVSQFSEPGSRKLPPQHEWLKAQLQQLPKTPISTPSSEGLEHAQKIWQATRDFRRYRAGG